jgi:hypothetical protein
MSKLNDAAIRAIEQVRKTEGDAAAQRLLAEMISAIQEVRFERARRESK